MIDVPSMLTKPVKCSNESTTNDQTDQEAKSNSPPDLSSELFVDGRVLSIKSLLQKGQQDRDDNATFNAFSEANEEDCAMISTIHTLYGNISTY
jgi:hypothetical protein